MTEPRSVRPDVPPQTRASDIDRVSILAVLDDALMDGQLDYREYRIRADGAGASSTLGELDALVADLQPSRPLEADADADPGESGSSGAGRWTRGRLAAIAAAALAVVIAVVVALTVAPGTDTRSPTATPADPVVAGTMFTAAAIHEVIDATRARFGTTVVEGIHLYPDNAEIYVFDRVSPVGHTHYDYSPGGEFYSPEYYSGLSVSSSFAPVDLSKIDAARVSGLIASAPSRLGITPAIAAKERFRVTVGGDDGGEIWMGVNDIGIDSHLVAHLDGTVKGVERCGWGC